MVMVDRETLQIVNSKVTSNVIIATIREIKHGETVTVACVYIKPSDNDRKLEETLQIIRQWMDSSNEDKFILMGDFNARLGGTDVNAACFHPSTYIYSKRNSNDRIVNSQGRNLQRLTEDLDLSILNGRAMGDSKGEFTYIGPNGSSTIDLCLCNSAAIESMTSFIVGNFSLSSHCPITVCIGKSIEEEQHSEITLRWKPDKKETICSTLVYEEAGSFDEFRDRIREAANYADMLHRKARLKKNLWFDNECKRKNKELKGQLQILRQAGSPLPMLREYQKNRKLFKATIRAKKEDYHKSIQDKINVSRNPTEFWKAITSLRHKPTAHNPIEESKWKEFYEQIMPEKPSYLPFYGVQDLTMDADITPQELEDALNKAKAKKATGPDGISAEFYKNLPNTAKNTMLQIMNNIFRSEVLPEDWGLSTTLMLHKKDDPNDPVNYRPITLLNAAMKIFMRIITSRLTEWAASNGILPEEQAGFRKKRGCDEQIFNLNAAIQIGTRRKAKVYALFIDFKRAFPSIPHDKLWEKLHSQGVSPKIIRILQNVYSNGHTKIRLKEGLSEPIPITEGLMQGCVASPILFTLYIADIVETLKATEISGINLEGKYTLHILLFADDMVLLASSPRSLQLKINALQKYFQRLGLHINVGKTKVVVFRRGGRPPSNLKFSYNKEPLEIVKEYLYLGVLFSNSCLFRAAAERSKRNGMKALGALWNIFYKGKVTNWDAHRKLFDSIVTSTVLYSGHIWANNYPDIIEKVQSQFVRRLFHLDCKTPTYALRLETNSVKIEHKLAKSLLNFTIRILLMENTRIAKISFFALLESASQDNKKFNWTLSLKTLLSSSGHQNIWNYLNAENLITHKASILKNLEDHLRNCDIERASESERLRYLSTLQEGKLLKDLLPLGLDKARLIAQIRLNQEYIYWKREKHDLVWDRKCPFCNLDEEEDLFHFLAKCRIHQPSHRRFLNRLQLDNITRPCLSNAMAGFEAEDLKKIALYCMTALSRRKLFLDLYLFDN
jgi:endonuclease/exonuclease/phosphatase family metal-dependent hydrolase